MLKNIIGFFTAFLLLAGCTSTVITPPTVLTPSPSPTVDQPTQQPLTVEILYPKAETVAEMGQKIKTIVEVRTSDGQRLPTARVSLNAIPAGGGVSIPIPITAGTDGVFRSEEFTIPHKSTPGTWTLEASVNADSSQSVGRTTFQVIQSTSEILLEKYGFWLDAPNLRGIVPTLLAEAGNARDGMIRWGGQIASQHILPANYIELNWRTGMYPLNTPDDVRKFLFTEVGNLGFTPIRDIGAITQETFKTWDAWKVEIRGKLFVDEVEYVVFYAPEVDKTFSFGTTVVQPLSGMDPHFELRKSFEVHPELSANGEAPVPLEHLLPGPVLLSPELDHRFTGTSKPIILTWQPLKDLEKEEYYEIAVDFDNNETTNTVLFFTRETKLTVPVELYSRPNCAVFNWSVVLKHRTGTDAIDRPTGYAVSYPSLYWYFYWLYPEGVKKPFNYFCPNPQT